MTTHAWDLEGDRCGAVDVLAVGMEEHLEEFLENYRRRLDAACGEWGVWEGPSKEWEETFDVKHSGLCRKVRGLIKDVELEILPVGVDVVPRIPDPPPW
jgi:hypothetical protein